MPPAKTLDDTLNNYGQANPDSAITYGTFILLLTLIIERFEALEGRIADLEGSQ